MNLNTEYDYCDIKGNGVVIWHLSITLFEHLQPGRGPDVDLSSYRNNRSPDRKVGRSITDQWVDYLHLTSVSPVSGEAITWRPDDI